MIDQKRATSEVARWVRAARQGDATAFGALVRTYQDRSVAYAASVLRDRDLAEDAAQEAFLEAFRTLGTLREPEAFGAWLRLLVFKQCDRIRRRKRLPEAPWEAAEGSADPAPSPYERLEAREAAHHVDAALTALTDFEREAVILFYMGDHSHAAIAEFLGTTPNAIKTRLHSARRRLRESMSDTIRTTLAASRPSGDEEFARRMGRLIQPEALKKRVRLEWSTGVGTDVWRMFVAAMAGDVKTLRRLLKRDRSLARAEYEGRTAMTFAVWANQLDAARLLLEHGASPGQSGTPDSLLQIARDRGLDEMARLIEAAIAGPSGEAPRGEPIARAIRDHDVATVTGLLDSSPDLLQAVDESGNQPIHWAVMTRQIDLIDLLIDRGADLNAGRIDGARPIHLTNGDYGYRGWRDVPADWPVTPDQVYDHIVARGAEVDLGMACATGNLHRVRAIVERDPEAVNRVSEYNSYYIGCGAPIKNAAVKGHLEIVRYLLDHGADPNLPEEKIAPQGHALYSAAANGHYETAKLLLERGAHANVEVESSADTLSRAISNNDERMIELLCSYGAARKVHLLAHYNDLKTAAAVFDADPARADDAGALGSASEPFARLMLRYRPELARRVSVTGPGRLTEMLFSHGMDPNHNDWLRVTPLHHQAEMGDIEGAALYLRHGADLHARDEQILSTPLAWAAKFNKALMVEYLLRQGAAPALPDDPEWATPRAWATRRGWDRVLAILDAFERDGALRERTRAEYDRLVDDLLAAYVDEDPEAMTRVADHFQFDRHYQFSPTQRWPKLKGRISSRLNEGRLAGEPAREMKLEDARRIIAQMHGLEGLPPE